MDAPAALDEDSAPASDSALVLAGEQLADDLESLTRPARKGSMDTNSNLSLSDSVKKDRVDQKRPLVDEEKAGATSGPPQAEKGDKELVALKEVLGVLRRTGMTMQELIAVLTGGGEGEEGKGAVDGEGKVPSKPAEPAASAAPDDDDEPIPEDPQLDWHASKLSALSLPELYRRRAPSFKYAEASDDTLAFEWERLAILGRVIGAKEKAKERVEEKERVLAGRQGRFEVKAADAFKTGLAKGRGEYDAANKEKKGIFKAIEDARDLNHLQRKEVKAAMSAKQQAATAAARRFIKEDGYAVLKGASGLSGTFAGSVLKAMAG